MSFLKIQNLSVDYKLRKETVHAAKDINIEIKRGEIVGLVGESGSGKTSLGMALLRLFPGHSYGTLRFGSEEYSTMSKRDLFKLRRKIQMVFQDPFSSL